MSELDEVRITTFLWHSMGDACVQCSHLDGQIYRNQDIFDNTLYDPMWGDILDLNTGQRLTHGHTGINCRCNCEVRIIFDIEQSKEFMDLKNIFELIL